VWNIPSAASDAEGRNVGASDALSRATRKQCRRFRAARTYGEGKKRPDSATVRLLCLIARFIPSVREEATRNGEFDGIGGRLDVISAIRREKVARGLSPEERPPRENEIRE